MRVQTSVAESVMRHGVDNLEALGERSYSGYVEKANDRVERGDELKNTCLLPVADN
jgi:hypothetical protein